MPRLITMAPEEGLINGFFVGLGHLDFDYGSDWKEQITTLALVYRLTNNLSIGSNIKRFVYKQGNFTNEQGLPAGEGETSKGYYFDFTSSYLLSFKTPVANKTLLLLGFTFENIFRQAINIGGIINDEIRVELPSVISLGANNKYVWNDVSNFFLIKNISLSLIAEYQEVIKYEYKTRFSLGAQVGLNEYIKFRAGYFRQNNNDHNISSNKSTVSDFTYGAGVTIPVSKFLSLNRPIILNLDYTRMQQPLFTTDNPLNIGKFSAFSVSVKIDI